jgi:hypothetical protein
VERGPFVQEERYAVKRKFLEKENSLKSHKSVAVERVGGGRKTVDRSLHRPTREKYFNSAGPRGTLMAA